MAGGIAYVSGPHFDLDRRDGAIVLHLRSDDSTNRLTRKRMSSLTRAVENLRAESLPLVLAGNEKFFSVGADLSEIGELSAPEAYEFSRMGQELMAALDNFPALIAAAVSGYCMGGGLDLALACHRRIASPNAVFGHRGAALGLITGWGGTQRLPRLVGKANALQIFVAAEKITATQALAMGLVDAIAQDPVTEAVRAVRSTRP